MLASTFTGLFTFNPEWAQSMKRNCRLSASSCHALSRWWMSWYDGLVVFHLRIWWPIVVQWEYDGLIVFHWECGGLIVFHWECDGLIVFHWECDGLIVFHWESDGPVIHQECDGLIVFHWRVWWHVCLPLQWWPQAWSYVYIHFIIFFENTRFWKHAQTKQLKKVKKKQQLTKWILSCWLNLETKKQIFRT